MPRPSPAQERGLPLGPTWGGCPQAGAECPWVEPEGPSCSQTCLCLVLRLPLPNLQPFPPQPPGPLPRHSHHGGLSERGRSGRADAERILCDRNGSPGAGVPIMESKRAAARGGYFRRGWPWCPPAACKRCPGPAVTEPLARPRAACFLAAAGSPWWSRSRFPTLHSLACSHGSGQRWIPTATPPAPSPGWLWAGILLDVPSLPISAST